jgi:hypothetical protein
MRHSSAIATRLVLSVAIALTTVALAAQGASKTYKGLDLSVGGVERTGHVSLTDCPPGANTVSSTAKPGEEFAVVTLRVKVSSGYKPEPIKRPTVTDTSGKVFNTAVSFVDVGKVPEFSCAIPFRVPAGTKLKSVQVETVSLDLPQ